MLQDLVSGVNDFNSCYNNNVSVDLRCVHMHVGVGVWVHVCVVLICNMCLSQCSGVDVKVTNLF